MSDRQAEGWTDERTRERLGRRRVARESVQCGQQELFFQPRKLSFLDGQEGWTSLVLPQDLFRAIEKEREEADVNPSGGVPALGRVDGATDSDEDSGAVHRGPPSGVSRGRGREVARRSPEERRDSDSALAEKPRRHLEQPRVAVCALGRPTRSRER